MGEKQEDQLVKDVADLKRDQAEIKTDMKWVIKLLTNHYNHHEKIIIGLILCVGATIGSLFIVLLGG